MRMCITLVLSQLRCEISGSPPKAGITCCKPVKSTFANSLSSLPYRPRSGVRTAPSTGRLKTSRNGRGIRAGKRGRCPTSIGLYYGI
ncbi:hypothetical protein EI94DRAFT_1744378 [Lactarius quietus]|nr:hypothetical protein EI94DRAFT_1744378 [Lactarius quietus]